MSNMDALTLKGVRIMIPSLSSQEMPLVKTTEGVFVRFFVSRKSLQAKVQLDLCSRNIELTGDGGRRNDP